MSEPDLTAELDAAEDIAVPTAAEWWLIGNNQFGIHLARGATAREAKADVRDRITDTYLGEGLSPSAARRAASSYHVFAIAGHLDYEVADNARRAWDLMDCGPALELARSHRNRQAPTKLAARSENHDR